LSEIRQNKVLFRIFFSFLSDTFQIDMHNYSISDPSPCRPIVTNFQSQIYFDNLYTRFDYLKIARFRKTLRPLPNLLHATSEQQHYDSRAIGLHRTPIIIPFVVSSQFQERHFLKREQNIEDPSLVMLDGSRAFVFITNAYFMYFVELDINFAFLSNILSNDRCC